MANAPKDLTLLGQNAALPASPDEARLERVAEIRIAMQITSPALPPRNSPVFVRSQGQPDLPSGIDYLPGRMAHGIEVAEALSRLLSQPRRLSRRLHAQDQRLFSLLKPRWFRIGAYFYPRGGMPIDVFWQTGTLPDGVWVPDRAFALSRALR